MRTNQNAERSKLQRLVLHVAIILQKSAEVSLANGTSRNRYFSEYGICEDLIQGPGLFHRLEDTRHSFGDDYFGSV